MPRLMFQRPRRIEWEELSPHFGRLVAEPFEKGYALTVGNSLRRVLLAAIPGSAPVWVRVSGVAPGASRIPGVQETVVDLLLNVKKVVVRLGPGAATAVLRLDVSRPGAVTAAALTGSGVDVVSPDVHLATVEPGGRLVLELGVRTGRGYVSADRHGEPPPAGAWAVDAAFSPIHRVNYGVEMSRLGNITDYEKLVLEVATDGSLTPDQAVLRASQLLRDHFELFTPAGAEEEDDEPSVPTAPAAATRPS